MTVTTSSSPTAVTATEGPASGYIEWGPLILGALGATAMSVVVSCPPPKAMPSFSRR